MAPDTGDGTIVDEDGLPARGDEPAGTQEPTDSETTTGTITFNSPDGVESVTIDGVTVTQGSLPQVIVDDETGTLVITDYTYDPVTGDGSIDYEYTLADNTSGDGNTAEFEVVVSDLDDDSAQDTLAITIIDDAPQAMDDSASQTVENDPITVDVFPNDIPGADGVDPATAEEVPGTLSGTGTLVNNGDGTFTYTPGPGEEDPVTFDYTITDSDGSESTATVTITLLEDSTPEIGVEGDDDVAEAGLAARGDEPAGSDEGSDSEIANGTIAINTGGDTIGTLVINGEDVTGGGTVTTAKGVLTITVTDGAYSYSYELTDNTLTEPDSDAFTLVVTDSDGDSANTSLVISILDDMPSAEDDTGSVPAGEYGPITGNVMTNDTEGADGASVTSYSGVSSGSTGETIDGVYGTLSIDAEGNYSYTRNPGTPGGVTDTFHYFLTDGDGDPADAWLVISIGDAGTTLDLPTDGEAGTQVLEEGLDGPPAGSQAGGDGEFTSGTITYTAPDGPATVTIDGVAVSFIGQTFTGDYGTLTIDDIAAGTISYTYELTTNTNGDNTSDSFDVVVSDADDESSSDTLVIAIVDDVPTADDDIDSVTDDGILVDNGPLTADGNVLTGTGGVDANATDGDADVQGADGATVTGVALGDVGADVDGSLGVPIVGKYGTLTLNGDGSYEYVLDVSNPTVIGLDGTESLMDEVFTYTITDGDTDTSTTTLTILVNGADDPVVINGLDIDPYEAKVYEENLSDGSNPNAAALVKTGSFTLASPDGLATLDVDGTQIYGDGLTYPVVLAGDYGELRITGVTPVLDSEGDVVSATVDFEYELSDNTLDHTAPPPFTADKDSVFDSFAVTVTDTDGSSDTASLDVRVVDDVPFATYNVNSVEEGGSVDGNVVTGDEGYGVDSSGADGYAADGPVVRVWSAATSIGIDTPDADGNFILTTPWGELTVNVNGSYTYESFANSVNQDALDVFYYVIEDADGDQSGQFLHIDIANVSGDVSDSDANVNEAGLPAGSDFGSDSHIDATGQITVLNAAGPFTYTLTGANSDGDGAYGTLVLDPDTGAYTYTLDTPYTDAVDENGPNVVNGAEGFTYEVRDLADNLIGTGTIQVNITDDVPEAKADTDAVEAAGPLTADGNVLTGSGGTDANATDGVEDTQGADGATVTGVAAGNSGAVDLSDPLTLGAPIVGKYGTLTLNGDGSYDYVLDDSNPTVIALADGAVLNDEVFSYTITDADGDYDTTTLTISVTGTNDAPDAESDSNWVLDVTTGPDPVTTGNVLDNNPHNGAPDAADRADVADSDIDGDALTVTAISDGGSIGATFATAYGSLLINSDGSYTYTLDNDHAAVVALDDGETLTETFTYTVSDGGLTDTAQLQITIFGTNDAPEAKADTNWTVEDAGAAITGDVLADLAHPGAPSGSFADVADTDPDVETLSVANPGTYNGTYGVLTLNADGTYSYELYTELQDQAAYDAVQALNVGDTPLTDEFSYTATDGDAVSDPSTLTISIFGANDAPVVTGDTALVSEEGLPGNNFDDVGNPTDMTNDVQASGQITITDVDNASHTVTLGEPTTPGLTSGGLTVNWQVSPDGKALVGSTAAGNVVLVAIDDDGNWTLDLVGSLDHADGSDENLLSFDIPVSVSDGVDSDSTTIAVTVEDDSPTAISNPVDGPTPGEDVNAAFILDFSGSIHNDELDTMLVAVKDAVARIYDNADGNDVTITLIGFSATAMDLGTYTSLADASAAIDGLNPAEGGTRPYNHGLTDFTAAIEATIVPGGFVPIPGANNQVFFLSDGNPNEQLGSGNNALADATVTAWAQFIADNDVSVTAIGIGDNISTGSLEDVDLDGDANVLLADDFDDLIDTLIDAVSPQPGGIQIPNTGSEVFTRLVNDPDGDTIGNDFIGADGFGSLTFIGGTDGDVLQDSEATGVTAGGEPIYLFGFGTDTLVATTDITNSDAGAKVFEVTLDQGTGYGADATYSIEFFQTLDNGSGFTFDDFSSAPAGQNEWMGFDADGGNINASQNNSEDLLITGLNGGSVNTSSVDIGSNNQWIDEDEGIRLDYVVDVAGGAAEKTAQGYTIEGHYLVNGSSFRVNQSKSGNPAVTIALFYDDDSGNIKDLDGSVVDVDLASIKVTNDADVDVTGSVTITDNGDGTVTVSNLLDGYTVSFAGVTDYNAVELSHAGAGDFALNQFGVESAVSGRDIGLGFDYQASDADGDTTDGAIDFIVTPAAVAPIAIDLDGDGVEFLGLADGVVYDYGEGQVSTAWVHGDDGLLAHQTADGLDIVFTDDAEGATSDLDGLARAYDSNGDGVFDAADTAFAEFGVWQDANSDGIADEGEFVSLTDAGIVSISLTSDGVAYSAAGGDVEVLGTAEITFADGSTGDAADATFAIDAVMDAMLSMGDDGEFGANTADMPLVAETVADALSDGAMDALVDSYAAPLGSDADAHSGSADLSALLASGTDSGLNVAFTLPEYVVDDTAMAVVSAA